MENKDNKQAILTIIENLVIDDFSDDIFDYINKLDVDNDNQQFCERFELGRWFEEAMDLNDISAITELERIATEHLKLESEDRKEAQLAKDLREMEQ